MSAPCHGVVDEKVGSVAAAEAERQRAERAA